MISTVLFDLDGVIRHFEPDVTATIERRHGITTGTIPRIAFTGTSVQRLSTGRLLRADWITEIGEALDNHEAAREWGAQRGRVDPAMLTLAGEIAAAGLRTSILTNGTDTLQAEIAGLHLDDHFAPIFNTAEIGFAKPDARAFTHVLGALGSESTDVLFIDDVRTNIDGAAALGIRTHHFNDAVSLRSDLRARGILP